MDTQWHEEGNPLQDDYGVPFVLWLYQYSCADNVRDILDISHNVSSQWIEENLPCDNKYTWLFVSDTGDVSDQLVSRVETFHHNH